MKKELQKQFEALVRERMSEFYAKAYTAAGNREEAETLTEDALVWAAGKFNGLANKARVIDLISERIGKGAHGGFETADENAIFMRAMEKVRTNNRKTTVFKGICTGVLALAVVIGVIVFALPKEEDSPLDTDGEQIEDILMNGTDVIEGDVGNLTLANYHNISDALNERTRGIDDDDIHSKLERHLATLIAPDGVKYMAFTHIPEEKVNENNMVTLYRMEKDGWKPLGTCEAQMNFGTSSKAGDYFYPSRIYMIADAKSNVYLFAILDESIVVYRYDTETGVFAKQNASLPIRYKPMVDYTFSIDHDTEKGMVYVGYCDQYKISFAYYDIAKDAFISLDYAKKRGQSQTHKMFCVKDGVLHLVEQNYSVNNSNLLYSRIEADGTVSKKTIFETKGWDISEVLLNRGRGQGGIAVDENGVVHILATRWDDLKANLVHYRITEDLTVEKETLPRLYYAGSDDYKAICGGLFRDENGDICYIEVYRSGELQNVFAVGKLVENIGDAPECIDVFEIPKNITHGFMRVQGKTVVFYANDDIYYFELKGMGG